MAGPVSLTLSTDVVPFAIRAERLEILVVRQPAGWRLPGGSLGAGENLDTAASRHLTEQTGLGEVYLEQLYTFGRPRQGVGTLAVAVAYYALVPTGALAAGPAASGAATAWISAEALADLRSDHADIVGLAHRRLASKLAYSTIALQLMPERFTLSELQAVNETILGEPLDKRNFRKRILALDCIEATGEMARSGGHRPARLYRAKRPGQVDFIK
ncbi:MAG TPA: NUDIX domain-containing protein [Candidatus Competibacter sp.]|nr:NUDIX hydrolase [Candidatus Competibacteraceae bacterium]HRC71666.1 NUDIX domain-containing protein [Candidatus Competibacter sp.]